MLTLRNIWAVWLKEMGAYFLSPIAYVVIFLFLLTNGTMFCLYTNYLAGQPRQVPMIIENLFGFALFWVLPLSPILTMRLFAEERRTGTLEVLMTAPVTELQVVLGKFLAVQVFYTLVWLSLLPLFGCLWALAIGKPDPGLLVSMYIGIFGLGLLTNALGLLASAATKNQLVAAVLALSGNLLFFLLSVWRVFFVEDMEWQRFLNYISFTYHFDNAYRAGVVDVRYLLYYGSFAFVFVLFTVRLLEARKWR